MGGLRPLTSIGALRRRTWLHNRRRNFEVASASAGMDAASSAPG